MAVIGCFNSTMVRLEDAHLKTENKIELLFQFHDGAIRRLMCITVTLNMWKFQFHDGAIRSGQQPAWSSI